MTTTDVANDLVEQANQLLDKAEGLLQGKEAPAGTMELIVVLDRSGSMSIIQDDMEQGLREFVRKQSTDNTRFTLAQFDTEYDVVFERKQVPDVNQIVLEPRGGTALLDAVGRTLCRMINIVPRENPVMFLIVTDGEENSSYEFTLTQVRELIGKCQKTRDWKFVYLGANVDSFDEAQALNISADCAMDYRSSARGTEAMCIAVGDIMDRVRRHEPARFTEDDRKAAMADDDDSSERA